MELASGFVFANTDGENVEEVHEEDMEEGWAMSKPVITVDSFTPAAAVQAAQPMESEESGEDEVRARSAPKHRLSGFSALSSVQPSRSPPSSRSAAPPSPMSRSPAPPSSRSPPSPMSRSAAAPPPAPQFAAPRAMPEMMMRRKANLRAESKRTFRQQVDTNVVCIKLGTLADGVAIHSGDAVFCKSCAAAFNDKSRLVEEGPRTLWHCEFCEHTNEVDLVREECPTSDSVDFILKPSESVAASLDENNIVFCMDISGSMCVTTEVPGQHAFRNESMRRMQASLREHMDGSMQRMPGQRRDISYVSRLQSVQGAVDAQIQRMKKNHPNRCIGLVTFNNEVQIIGDGTGEKITVAGDRLESRETLVDIAAQSNLLTRPVAETSAALAKHVFALEEGGQTALGPALLLSVAMAAKRPGGRVVLCTDGKANVGLGSLDVDGVEADATAGLFYDEIAQFAKEKGVVVDVVSITGTECRLEHLGRVADVTGGSVERVDPLHLADNFQSMLEKPVVATKVSVRMQLHSGLCFRDEGSDASVVTRDVGAATTDSEVLFEFTLRPEFLATLAAAQEAAATASAATAAAAPADAAGAAVDEDQMDTSEEKPVGATAGTAASAAPAAPAAPVPRELPFQVQIRYTKPDGMECMRVITKAKPVTTDRRKCEETVDVALCSAHVAQKSARLAQEGKYDQARVNGYAWRNMLGKVATSSFSSVSQQQQYNAFDANLQDLDDAVHSAQMVEMSAPAMMLSPQDQSSRRSAARSDSHSHAMFKSKKATSAAFKK